MLPSHTMVLQVLRIRWFSLQFDTMMLHDALYAAVSNVGADSGYTSIL